LRENIVRLGCKHINIRPWEQHILSNLAWMKVKKSDIGYASKLFQKFDSDKNGLISILEFKKGVEDKLGMLLEDK